MRKPAFWLITFLLICFNLALSPISSAQATDFLPSSAYDLIAEVNALRASNGLPAYNPNSILMSVAQGHADYMAANQTVTHYGPGGTRPFQRGLAAGYPVAGDLSLGGFYSENIIAGNKLTAAEAIQRWQGDAPHLNTMLSANLVDIGAGAASVGDYMYYVIDAARPSGSSVSYTPQAGETAIVPALPPVSPVIPNTPQADGSIIHEVQPGQTLWTIAAVYGVSVDDIMKLNNMAQGAFIYPGDKLTIRSAVTATPETPSETPVPSATLTSQPLPSRTPKPSPTPTPALPTSAGQSSGMLVVVGIILLSLAVAGGVTWISGRKPV